MKKLVAGIVLVAVAAGSGYAAGGRFQAPRIVTVTETKIEQVDVPGATVWKWRTKRVPFVPQACLNAIDAGHEMIGILDDWFIQVNDLDDLFEDTYNSVDDAFNAGARGEGSQSTSLALDQLERRSVSIRADNSALLQAGYDVPFNTPAAACEDR